MTRARLMPRKEPITATLESSRKSVGGTAALPAAQSGEFVCPTFTDELENDSGAISIAATLI